MSISHVCRKLDSINVVHVGLSQSHRMRAAVKILLGAGGHCVETFTKAWISSKIYITFQNVIAAKPQLPPNGPLSLTLID